MKKVISLLCAMFLLFGFVGCGSSSSSNDKSTKGSVSKEVKKPMPTDTDPNEEIIKIKLPAGIKELGKGRIEIVTQSGNSKDGVIPFVYVDKDTWVEQIGFNAWDFDGSKLSYIFIDGVLNEKEQLKDSQRSLSLKHGNLKPGTRKIEVVQYDNDKIDGNVVAYKTASCEVKSK